MLPSLRAPPVFTKLAQAGIAVHSFDAMAHGKSDPKGKKDRAVIWRFKDLVRARALACPLHACMRWPRAAAHGSEAAS